MPLLRYPKELNGIPLSPRSQHLVFGPIEMLMPRVAGEGDPFKPGGWLLTAAGLTRTRLMTREELRREFPSRSA